MLIGCCLISHFLVLDPPAADHGEQHRLELLAAPAVDDDVDAAVDDHEVPAEDNSASKIYIRRFVIAEKAPTRTFSRLKAPILALSHFKTLC